MPWSFSTISSPVELVYTQSVGWSPDVAMLRFNPQVASIAATGTITLNWDATTITLPNCVVDLGTLRMTSDGRYMTLRVLDRRERWKYAAPISGEYNVIRTNDFVTAKKKSLRELGALLMTALGEVTAVVTALPTDVYPPVSWECDSVVEAAEALLSEYGFSVALGFGSEAVTVVQLGTGATLSITDRFAGSDTYDVKLAPRYLRNCFAPSVAQVRLKLEAVGQDTDGTWVPINDLSFAPVAGWYNVAPYTLNGPLDALTDAQKLAAQAYVYRAYRVSGFADSTWDLPDGSGTLNDLSDILPISNRLLTTEDLRPDLSYSPATIYGKYMRDADELANPVVPGSETTVIGDRVSGRGLEFYGDTGLVVFHRPIYYVDEADDYQSASLWLEATIQVRDTTTFAWRHYEYDVSVYPSGVGYHTVKHDLRAETVVEYNSSHEVTGTVTNQADLEDLGNATAVSVAALYTATVGQFVAYNKPKLNLRCDGAILQVQHVLTCGEHGHAVNRTSASANFEFDRGIPKRAQRVAHLRALEAGVQIRRQERFTRRAQSLDD
jgi:hypothetical protein